MPHDADDRAAGPHAPDPSPTVPRGVPTGTVPVPASVAALAGGQDVEPVWVNEAGGRTFRLGRERFVKWAPRHVPELDLPAEALRLTWAGRFTPVPEVLDLGVDDEGSWLVTAAIPARSAVDPMWLARPAEAAAAVGAGLRALHDALPAGECPFAWQVEARVERALEHLHAGDSPTGWDPVHHHLSAADARARLLDAPPVDRLVVCHADACAPNTLVHDDGRWAAHVDLGRLGVADRWADLAIATWSTTWNYGPGYERHVLDAYGIEPDDERTAYYRLLWDAT
ncbi:aminoglycoside phosphotransferase [Cellulomonas flavigena DSM 20109]|uniref:Aminoglycoside phosphotransferase n=1 Tax=Cellulomonas flavigena (strain ATCC 482 / DSM 20109 / BCRC 11376 / JCM 18109 / NBRC 3775 / NCIMB 8073 / NRS 134) TaxID=446466 RepID=D5UBJ1_CELFN|nr:aminoglycoside 3'-phosphotransferase [Cellulomonas flavigena]ADG74086.1 aminoglycoside phosphotransferase [Cellulomonas flavigena DSM 20109]